MKSFPSLLASFFAFSGLSSAAIVNIDFNQVANNGSDRYVGTAAADYSDPGTQWNYVFGVTPGTISGNNLVTSTGGATTIDVSISGVTSISLIGSGEQERQVPYSPLMRDFLLIDVDPSLTSGSPVATINAANSTVITASGILSGLTVGASYDIYFYGQGGDMSGPSNQFAGENSLFTIGSTSFQTGWDGTAGGLPETFPASVLDEGVEYVRFASIVANSSGEILFSWSNVVPDDPNTIGIIEGNLGLNGVDLAPNSTANVPKGAKSAGLNAIQIVELVPEPSSFLLGALGMIGLVFRRRRLA